MISLSITSGRSGSGFLSLLFGFFTIDKSDRSVRFDSNKMLFLRIITI